jgi:predicted ribosome quality control (RQC) complex YloA/Tae2 family protein
MKSLNEGDILIKIGKNAQENWELLDTDENYIWMHLNSYPSCHLIIECDNPSNEMLYLCALHCKENTKYKKLKNLKICYTTIGNLIKGKEVGSVIFKSKRKVKYITV